MLTDNCEIEFKTWYNREFENRNLPYINGFEISDLSIRFGVYVDFFDEHGIYIQNIIYDFENKEWEAMIECEEDNFDTEITDLTSRKESREQAILKANEIFNNLNN